VDNVVAPVAGAARPGLVVSEDRIRWGPIWGGLIATFATFLLLETLATGIGLISPTNGAVSAWTSGIVALLAFFVGGWMAEATSAVRGVSEGLVNGLMVWALGITLFVVLSLIGLGALFGAIGSLVGQFFAPGHVVVAPTATDTRGAGWGAFFTLLASALAAGLGGWLGASMFPVGFVGRRNRP